MNIFAISVVKNEADIIEANLKAASSWARKIFVLDNGSTDGTWEKVLALADDIITPWKQDFKPFQDSVRSEVYNHFKHLSKSGDWWCIRLDADEFYPKSPAAFLKKVPSAYHYVCSKFIQFRLTTEDIEEYEFGGDFESDKRKIKYCEQCAWVEARFLRFRRKLVWHSHRPFPRHMGIVYPKPISMHHFQYRSPKQVQLRLDVRNAAKALGHHSPHVQETHWKETMVSRKSLFHIEHDKLNVLQMPHDQNYLHKPFVYIMKKLLHGLRILP